MSERPIYFCHTCKEERDITPNWKCIICNGGFVERQVPEPLSNNTSSAATSTNTASYVASSSTQNEKSSVRQVAYPTTMARCILDPSLFQHHYSQYVRPRMNVDTAGFRINEFKLPKSSFFICT